MTIKICIMCLEKKLISDFYRRSSNKDGFELRCKPCYIIFSQKRNPRKLVKYIYIDQRKSSVRRNHEQPSYTEKELYQWVTSHVEFEALWNTWVESNYDRYLRPSIDRLNDDIPYRLSNIRLVTWGINYQKACEVDKTNKSILSSKPIQGTSLADGTKHTFISAGQAGRWVNGNPSNIGAVANEAIKQDRSGHTYIPKSAYGYVWKWI